jgi:hypothetical protein
MDLPEINPVEKCLAVIGVRPIISRKVEHITKATLAEIEGLLRQIERLARKLVRNDLTETFHSDLNYRQTLKDLARGVDVHQVEEMVKGFPPQYRATGTALALAASGIIQGLLKLLPKSEYQTLSGVQTLIPPSTKIFRFVSILEVLDALLQVFALMNTGALLRSQAAAMRAVYPTLSAAIDAAIFEAITAARATKKSFQLAPRAEIGVKAWQGQGPVSKSSLQLAQANVQRQKDRQAAQKQPTGTPPARATASEKADMTPL